MQRVTGLANAINPVAGGDPTVDNSKQFFDVEVIDAFTMVGPNHTEHVIVCPLVNATENIVDDVSAGLGGAWSFDNGGGGSQLTLVPGDETQQTRCGHVVKYNLQTPPKAGSTDTTAPPNDKTKFAYGIITDCMTFDGPINSEGMPYVTEAAPSTAADIPAEDDSVASWGALYGMTFESPDKVIHGALQPDAACIDLTEYVTDPVTGLQIPPPPDPAVDLNNYVFFPPDSAGPWLGDGSPDGLPPPAIDTGPLWWIRQLGSTVNVWFWYITPRQEQLAISYYSDPPDGVQPSWGYRGFCALPYFSVIYILSANYPEVPLGLIGADNLEIRPKDHRAKSRSVGRALAIQMADGA
jgi:hypothetical protein